MKSSEVIASVLGLAVASGLNLYAAVLTVGLGERLGWISGLPPELDILKSPWVLALAGIMYAIEFVADKVPFITPIWDGIHTFIRPLGGALLAVGAAGQMNPMAQALAGLAGGTLALGTHSTKMGMRLAAHAIPEPITHSAISVTEDFSAVGILLLAFHNPTIALVVLGVMILGMIIALPLIYKALKSMWTGMKRRLDPVEETSAI